MVSSPTPTRMSSSLYQVLFDLQGHGLEERDVQQDPLSLHGRQDFHQGHFHLLQQVR
ncbi:MAG: hypothetical protein HGA55_06460, partial [Methanoregulaceae archaeon]|nr:hypothetical protein [Methanoregulaceae archaeon]